MSDFKVGDKVKFKNEYCGCCNLDKNSAYTVQTINGVLIIGNYSENGHPRDFCTRDSDWVLVTTGILVKDLKFKLKPGTRIKMISDSYYSYKNGAEYKIVKLPDNDKGYITEPFYFISEEDRIEILEGEFEWFAKNILKVELLDFQKEYMNAYFGIDFASTSTNLEGYEQIKGETNMELKEIKTANLIEAKRLYEEKCANEEVVVAMRKLQEANDCINTIDREIARLQESKKTHLETLSLFESKKKR